MPYTFEELKAKSVAELREVAKTIQHEAVQGATQMNKEHLLVALCKALHIDMHHHHHVVGLDKTAVKREIRELKKRRDDPAAAKSRAEMRKIHQEIHERKHKLRRAMV